MRSQLAVVVVLLSSCAHASAVDDAPSAERAACLLEAKGAAWSDAERSCDMQNGVWEDCPARPRIVAELEQTASRCPP